MYKAPAEFPSNKRPAGDRSPRSKTQDVFKATSFRLVLVVGPMMLVIIYAVPQARRS